MRDRLRDRRAGFPIAIWSAFGAVAATFMRSFNTSLHTFILLGLGIGGLVVARRLGRDAARIQTVFDES